MRKQFEMFFLFQMLSPTWCTNLLSKLSNLDLRYASSVHQRALHLQKFPGQKMAWSFQAPRGNLKLFDFMVKKQGGNIPNSEGQTITSTNEHYQK